MTFKTHQLSEKGKGTFAEWKVKVAELAAWANTNLEGSREKSLTLTKLEEASMWGAVAVCLPEENHDSVKEWAPETN